MSPSDFIATADAANLIGAVVETSMPDVQRIRDRIWATPLSDEVTAMVTLDHWKGGQFTIGYGICCSWVPYAHQRGRKIEWPTTIRQSVKHLWVDHFTIETPRAPYISRIDGPHHLQRGARDAVNDAEPKARTWWRSVATVEDVLVEAQRQASNPYDIHSPRAAVVVAFTFARLGDLPAARQHIAPVLELMAKYYPQEAERLAALLEETPGRQRAGDAS